MARCNSLLRSKLSPPGAGRSRHAFLFLLPVWFMRTDVLGSRLLLLAVHFLRADGNEPKTGASKSGAPCPFLGARVFHIQCQVTGRLDLRWCRWSLRHYDRHLRCNHDVGEPTPFRLRLRVGRMARLKSTGRGKVEGTRLRNLLIKGRQSRRKAKLGVAGWLALYGSWPRRSLRLRSGDSGDVNEAGVAGSGAVSCWIAAPLG